MLSGSEVSDETKLLYLELLCKYEGKDEDDYHEENERKRFLINPPEYPKTG